MKVFKKIHWLIYPVLCVVFILLLDFVFNIESSALQTVLGVSLAYVLSPKYKIIEKQTGEEEQIKWLFFKKVINQPLK